jgi:hypothetical protein
MPNITFPITSMNCPSLCVMHYWSIPHEVMKHMEMAGKGVSIVKQCLTNISTFWQRTACVPLQQPTVKRKSLFSVLSGSY